MKRNDPIGVIAAMDSELEQLLGMLEGKAERTICGLQFYMGTLYGRDVVLLKCGIGKVNAARGAQILIDMFHPAALVNTGIAGGLALGLAVGDIVVATGALQHDFDVTAFGHVKGYLCTGEDDTRPTVFAADPALRAALQCAAEAVLGAEHVHEGVIATGDQFISGAGKKAYLSSTFGAMAAEMEGGAIAQVAQLSGVPFAILRAISDLADGTAAESFDTFERKAAKASADTLLRALETL